MKTKRDILILAFQAKEIFNIDKASFISSQFVGVILPFREGLFVPVFEIEGQNYFHHTNKRRPKGFLYFHYIYTIHDK